MEFELRNPKGTNDYSPEAQSVRQKIVRILQAVFERYGFQPLETPILCHYDVLASKYGGGAEILKETYRLSDQGKRELGLRYDLTVPFARYIGMNPTLRLPFKRYEIGKVFRDGPVKLGRNREFTQCDVDVVGVSGMLAEAELMAMTVDVFAKLGLEVEIRYNNRKLLAGIIALAGIPSALNGAAILVLDKLEKIGRPGVQAELEERGVPAAAGERLLELISRPEADVFTAGQPVPGQPLLMEGWSELRQLQAYLSEIDQGTPMRFSPSLARGLAVYTGTVWEIFLRDGSISSSVGAGGRYDRIIGTFIGKGGDYPAVGMTFGLDVIYEALMLKDIALVQSPPPVDLLLIPLGTEPEAFGMVSRLRRRGYRVALSLNRPKLKKAFDDANKLRIPLVVVLGENELARGQVKLKRMLDGAEIVISIEQLEEGGWEQYREKPTI